MARRVGTRHGNICLSARTSQEIKALKLVGKSMEKMFNNREISVKACIPKANDSKQATKRLVFEIQGHLSEEKLQDLRSRFDLLENGVIKITSIPLDFFLEGKGDSISVFRSLVDETSFRINTEGNLVITCTCKQEDVSAARELFSEAGLEVRDKVKRRYELRPGFIAIIKIADIKKAPEKKRSSASSIVPATPAVTTDTTQQPSAGNAIMDMVKNLVTVFLQNQAGSEEDQIALAKSILPGHIGLFDHRKATPMPFVEEALAIKPL